MSHQLEKLLSRFILRRRDQATIAALALFALTAMGLYWLTHRSQLIDIDETQPLKAEFLVDINTAHWPELATLPEVGITMAKRIVDHRQQHGPFASIEDLKRVHGIGPKTFERLKPYIRTVHPSAVSTDETARRHGSI